MQQQSNRGVYLQHIGECTAAHLDRFWSFLQHSTLYANSSMVLPVITMPKVAKLL